MLLVILALTFILFYAKHSVAYLDGGTGAMIIQFIIAAFAGLVAYIGVSYQKVKKFIKTFFKK